ncbi:hypothetical protein SMALB_7736 [Streptomyces malaysiensis]|uniref:Uncharacterized protein n=1 Tax=Streptomyces malaysiensis TaxID=92644 RepID=A0A7X5XAF1_STRMQ|nr:hypothetical protein [Streptomyces malaysiensis]
MAGDEGPPAADGVEESGQQPRHGLRPAAGEQPGGLAVAPALPVRLDQPVREGGAPPGHDGAREFAPYGGGRVLEGRRQRVVRDRAGAAAAGGVEGAVPHHGVRVGQTRREMAGAPSGGRGHGRQPPLVRPAPLQLLDQRTQPPLGTGRPRPPGQLPHPARKGQRVECGEQFVGKCAPGFGGVLRVGDVLGFGSAAGLGAAMRFGAAVGFGDPMRFGAAVGFRDPMRFRAAVGFRDPMGFGRVDHARDCAAHACGHTSRPEIVPGATRRPGASCPATLAHIPPPGHDAHDRGDPRPAQPHPHDGPRTAGAPRPGSPGPSGPGRGDPLASPPRPRPPYAVRG